MKRVKTKKKKPPEHRPAKTPYQIVSTTNYFVLACIVRTLYTVYGWRQKRLDMFMEAYMALMAETADHRTSVNQAIQDCYELTGINVVEYFNQSYERICEND